MKRSTLWILFLAALILTFGLKATQNGWFTAREPLARNNDLVFFTLSNGCECQMLVIHVVEAQLTGWNSSLPLLRVYFDRHPDLAEQFGIFRAPALILVHADDQVVWKQDEGLSDELLLDLKQAEIQIESLVQNP